MLCDLRAFAFHSRDQWEVYEKVGSLPYRVIVCSRLFTLEADLIGFESSRVEPSWRPKQERRASEKLQPWFADCEEASRPSRSPTKVEETFVAGQISEANVEVLPDYRSRKMLQSQDLILLLDLDIDSVASYKALECDSNPCW